MILTTLGTSHGDPTGSRFNSSILLEAGSSLYLLDAGEPVTASLRRAEKRFDRLRAVFITHMHGDHVGGLPVLIKMLLKYAREGQHADVFLPERGALAGLEAWLRAMRLPWPSTAVSLHTIEEGAVYADEQVNVTAVRTRHLAGPAGGPASFGFVVEGHGQRVVYTGDLSANFREFPAIAGAMPCDLCVCEAQHVDATALVTALRALPIRRLVFTHIADRWHDRGEDDLGRLASGLPFPCRIAHDGDRFEVEG